MKYSELLNKSYKKEMILDISKDLNVYYPKMEELEVKFLANQIYNICISLCYKVNLEKIVQMMHMMDNGCYFINQQTNTEIKESAINDENSIHLATIVNKYIEEIKKRL